MTMKTYMRFRFFLGSEESLQIIVLILAHMANLAMGISIKLNLQEKHLNALH